MSVCNGKLLAPFIVHLLREYIPYQLVLVVGALGELAVGDPDGLENNSFVEATLEVQAETTRILLFIMVIPQWGEPWLGECCGRLVVAVGGDDFSPKSVELSGDCRVGI